MATTFASLITQARRHLNEVPSLVTPGAPLVSPQGTTGSTSITYKITAVNSEGESDASQGTTIATAAATLSATDYNQLTWTAVPGADSYNIYRTATNGTSPTTTGLIGSATASPFNDTGSAGDASTAPTDNTSGLPSTFWTDQELFDIALKGARDLWRSIIDLRMGHFTEIDETNVSLSASTGALTGVPTGCFRVTALEPRTLSSDSSTGSLVFRPKPYTSDDFKSARGRSSITPQNDVIYYDILNPGSPITGPSIVVAPQVSSAVALRLVYTSTLSSSLTTASNNPIPGESDQALISWIVAWAYQKQREDHMPDPGWLATYQTEKQSVLSACTPRQEQEEMVVEGVFDGLW